MIYSKIFSLMAVLSAVGVCLSGDYRKSILFLWCVGLAVSGMYLSNHAEFVALVQSISASLICVGFLVFSSSFGGVKKEEGIKVQTRVFSIFASAACALVVSGALIIVERKQFNVFHHELTLSSDRLGGQMTGSQNLLALIIVVLAVFASLVGSASVSRPEERIEGAAE